MIKALVTGVTTAFVREVDPRGRLRFDYAVLEVDEAAFPGVAALVNPQAVVVTNFFRDQLDRYGEPDTTVALIHETLKRLLGSGWCSKLENNSILVVGPVRHCSPA